jgi:two-component system NtrC family sensor kinase
MVDSTTRDGSRPQPTSTGNPRRMRLGEGVRLSQAILDCANRHLGKLDFLREVSTVLLDFFACDAIEVRLSDRDLHYRWRASRHARRAAQFERVQWTIGQDGRVIPAFENGSDLEEVCRYVAGRCADRTRPFFTDNGSFWTGDTWQPLTPALRDDEEERAAGRFCVGGHYRSLIVTRFVVDEQTIGLLQIMNERPHSFCLEEVEFCEEVAQAFGLAVGGRRARADLRERVKELTCLYGIARVAEQPGLPLKGILQRIVELLPPAWFHPEIAAARIVLDGHSHATNGYRPSEFRQSSDIMAGQRKRGIVEVVYLEEKPDFMVGVFLPEEEKLIEAVAREVGLIVEQKEAEEEKSKLQQQLIHADRLATIGQLAAGVAHELNEPLGSILGFAQLTQKCPGLPQQSAKDIEKIATASLYAREIIKKLMVFARQVPPKIVRVDLNQVVEEGLYFLEARCAKASVHVVRALDPGLPEITADPAQLKQVLVNLVVNALQAMPDGGTLTIRTRVDDPGVCLDVEDTGAGMSPEIREKVFLPFFTTKDVNEGTGLGLAVVHGIVAAHGGSIEVESQPGRGARFEIRLPLRPPGDSQKATEGKGHA